MTNGRGSVARASCAFRRQGVYRRALQEKRLSYRGCYLRALCERRAVVDRRPLLVERGSVLRDVRRRRIFVEQVVGALPARGLTGEDVARRRDDTRPLGPGSRRAAGASECARGRDDTRSRERRETRGRCERGQRADRGERLRRARSEGSRHDNRPGRRGNLREGLPRKLGVAKRKDQEWRHDENCDCQSEPDSAHTLSRHKSRTIPAAFDFARQVWRPWL